MARLEDEVGQMALVLRALLAHSRELDGWDEERFLELLDEIDAEDGEVDGHSTMSSED